MAALIPIGLAAAGAIPGFISGILGAINEGKRLRGGRLKHKIHAHGRRHRGGRLHKRKYHHKRGRGVVADTLGSIPLLGAVLGPLAKAFGGRIKAGRGLSPMYIHRPYVGMGLAPYGRGHHIGGALTYRKGYYKHVGRKRIHVKPTIVHNNGRGLSPMYMTRPYVGMGLLAPAGGRIRRGHYRMVGGKRVHVRAARVHHGGRMLIAYKKKAY